MQRRIDIAIEEIPHEKNRWSKSTAKSKPQYNDINDFLLGFEYGGFPEDSMWYYRNLVNKRRGRAAGEETQHVANEINTVILDWVPTSYFKGNLSFSSCANVFTGIVVIFVG